MEWFLIFLVLVPLTLLLGMLGWGAVLFIIYAAIPTARKLFPAWLAEAFEEMR